MGYPLGYPMGYPVEVPHGGITWEYPMGYDMGNTKPFRGLQPIHIPYYGCRIEMAIYVYVYAYAHAYAYSKTRNTRLGL